MIDPNEAPEGYYAVHAPDSGDTCYGCALRGCEGEHTCMDTERQDGQSVIFIKRDAAPAPQPEQAEPVLSFSQQDIDAFIEGYEMLGEDEDGRDACHTPTEGERAIIKDAIIAFLSEHVDTHPAPQRAPLTPRPEIVDRVMRFAGKRKSTTVSYSLTTAECVDLADWLAAHGIKGADHE